MQPRIETLIERKLIGKRMKMSFSKNKTYELWHGFMPLLKEIKNKIGNDLFSLQFYDPKYFENFDPTKEFEKWAAMEVTDFSSVPDEMETLILTGGLYAVFIHNGAASTAAKTFEYIFETWLPNSDYLLDDRAHFEILGEKYKNEDPNSEEEVWIPIKLKNK